MLLFVVILAVIAVAYYIYSLTDGIVAEIVFGVTTCMFAILCIIVFANWVTKESTHAANQQLYDSLTYQLEHDVYKDDSYGKSELYKQITKWNTDLAEGRILQDNIWIGALVPNYYYDFEFIEFPEGG